MTEQDAICKFYDYANYEILEGAMEALKFISDETLNRQDDDGYDMLIQACVAENKCAVEALLRSGRCDLTHRDSLCGMTAEEYAEESPELKKLFNK